MQDKILEEIVVFLTGGTIAMRSSPLGAIPADDLEESLALALASARVSLRFVPWASKPSPHITPQDMFRLARDMGDELAKDTVRGAIVLHGTDLLAETAFVLDRVLVSRKPVVCSGSMRHMDENGYDGIRNVASSVLACLAMPESSEVLVQMADLLYTATDAAKFDSMSVVSFVGMTRGTVGRIANGKAVFTQNIAVERPRLPFSVTGIGGCVPLISCYPGISFEDLLWPCGHLGGDSLRHESGTDRGRQGGAFPADADGVPCGVPGESGDSGDSCVSGESGTLGGSGGMKTLGDGSGSGVLWRGPLPDGVVIEAFGAGNVPPGLLDFIDLLLDNGVPVVLASRVPKGGVMPLYGYPGGGGYLLSKGVLSAGILPASKAQLLLKMALASGSSATQLQEVFPV